MTIKLLTSNLKKMTRNEILLNSFLEVIMKRLDNFSWNDIKLEGKNKEVWDRNSNSIKLELCIWKLKKLNSETTEYNQTKSMIETLEKKIQPETTEQKEYRLRIRESLENLYNKEK